MNPLHMIVLAGGFGTRLRSAVSDVPKPLAPVGDRPYLQYLLDNWAGQGVTSFTFLLHHQAALIENFLDREFAHGTLKGLSWNAVVESQPLGTGGAIAHAVRHLALDADFLVGNADTWLASGVRQLAATPSPAVAIVEVQDGSRYGCVRMERDMVTAFGEKAGNQGPAWINAGMYRLHSVLFRDWDGRAFSLEHDVFPSLAAARRLKAVPLHGDFIDIGIPEDYRRFCRWIESGKGRSL